MGFKMLKGASCPRNTDTSCGDRPMGRQTPENLRLKLQARVVLLLHWYPLPNESWRRSLRYSSLLAHLRMLKVVFEATLRKISSIEIRS
jgi:hypothetical protein